MEGGEYTPAMRLIEGQENTAERSPLLPTTADEFRKMLDLVLHDSSSSQKLPNKMFEAIISVHSKHYPHFEKSQYYCHQNISRMHTYSYTRCNRRL